MLAIAIAIAAVVAAADERPLEGDVLHGQQVLKAAGGDVRVDGAWINAATEEQNLAFLAAGKNDFPRIESDDVLDRWDVLAYLRSKNSDLRDLMMGADTVLVVDEKLDENAEKRLTDQAKISSAQLSGLRVFGLYKLGDGGFGPAPFFVGEKDNKKRDKLKKTTKVGYVVFAKLPGFRGGKYEVAFAVDKDIHIQKVFVRGPDGDAPTDLNQAAARFEGKGARGQYALLKAGGAGKAIGELEKPLSEAFLLAAENIYMFEVAEKDYFAFGD
jgi:hypothetical protein